MTKRFSASSAAQLMACHGSANLELAIPGWVQPPRKAGGAKQAGTDVHAVLEPFSALWPSQLDDRATLAFELAKLHFTKRRAICDDAAEATLWAKLQKQAALRYDDDKIEWLQSLRDFAPATLRFIGEAALYIADIADRMTFHMSPVVVMAEEALVADWLPSTPGTTPDVTYVGEDVLEVVDYKNGKIPVSPVDNDQGMFYAACKIHLAPKAKEFTIHIVQPGNVNSWTAPIEHLHKWMNEAINADRAIMAKDLTLTPNDHCTFCPANPQSRGEKAGPYCPPMMKLLYPGFVDEAEILSM